MEMNNEEKLSPLPWRVEVWYRFDPTIIDANDEVVAFSVSSMDAAERIVNAVNSHVERDHLATALSARDKVIHEATSWMGKYTPIAVRIEAIRTLPAKVKALEMLEESLSPYRGPYSGPDKSYLVSGSSVQQLRQALKGES